MNKIKECVRREDLSHAFIWRLANYKVLLILIASSLAWSAYKAKEGGVSLEPFDLLGSAFVLSFGYILNLVPAVLCRLLLRKRIRYSVNFSCAIALAGWGINAIYQSIAFVWLGIDFFHNAMVGSKNVIPILLVSVCSYKILRSRCGVASIGFYCRGKTRNKEDDIKKRRFFPTLREWLVIITVIFSILLYIPVHNVFFVKKGNDLYNRGAGSICFIISFIVLLWFVFPKVHSIIKDGNAFYRNEKPEKAVSCYVVACFWGALWFLFFNYGVYFLTGHTMTFLLR